MRTDKALTSLCGYTGSSEHCLLYDAICTIIIGPQRENSCLPVFASNTGADQPAHPRSLLSAFVIRFLENTIFNLATRQISIF